MQYSSTVEHGERSNGIYSCRYPDGDADQHGDQHSDADSDADADRDPNGHANADSDADADSYANADADGDANDAAHSDSATGAGGADTDVAGRVATGDWLGCVNCLDAEPHGTRAVITLNRLTVDCVSEGRSQKLLPFFVL
jgi:hypothetical protein